MLAQGSKLWARNKVRNAFDTYDMARVIKKSLKELPPELKQGLSKLSTSEKLKALSNRFADAKTNPALKELVKIIEKSPEKLNNIINNAEKMSEYEIEKEIKFYIRGLEEKLGTNVTYKGYAMAVDINQQAQAIQNKQEPNAFYYGQSTFNVDFANKKMTGTLNDWQFKGSVTAKNKVEISADIRANTFKGTANTGTAEGKFYGPKAQNLAGAFNDKSQNLQGVFGANKQ